MDFKKFYLAVRRYVKRRITHEMFLIDWKDAQHSQNIEVVKWSRIAPVKVQLSMWEKIHNLIFSKKRFFNFRGNSVNGKH